LVKILLQAKILILNRKLTIRIFLTILEVDLQQIVYQVAVLMCYHSILLAADAVLWIFITIVLIFIWQIILICSTLHFGANLKFSVIVVIILKVDLPAVEARPLDLRACLMAVLFIQILSIYLQRYIAKIIN